MRIANDELKNERQTYEKEKEEIFKINRKQLICGENNLSTVYKLL